MTWQTAAVRYVSIGEKSARFRDLTLPFDLDGEPVETVIWLPNGGGKSSLMSLKSAVVLPASRDFTGAGREDGEKRPRRLDDYVGSGDTSHTVIEWTRDDNPSLLGTGHRLLTGAVYEWPDRRRPTLDADTKLNKFWWSAVPAAGILDLDHLPVRDGRLLTLNQFRDTLRKLNTAHPELQIQISGTQNQWEEELGKLGIDTALYRYQAKMNTSEGGIAKVFNFNTTRDFINLVVDVIARPDQAADCGKVVNQHAKNLFRRPVLQTERGFLTEAHTILGDLAAAHDQVTSAAAHKTQAQQAAADLRVGLTSAAGTRDAVADADDYQAEQLGERASETRRERGRVEGVRAELLHRAAVDRHSEAAERLDAARTAQAVVRADAAAWSAAAPLAEAAGHDATAAHLRERLAPERAERDELRLRLDTVAVAAVDLLTGRAAALEAEAETAQQQVAADRSRATAIGTELAGVRGEISTAERAAAAATALLEDHQRALTAARRADVLVAGEAPAAALTRHTTAAAAAERDAAEHTENETRHRETAAAAARDAAACGAEHVRLLTELHTAEHDQQQLAAAHTRVATHPRLVALAEADQVIDPWGDAARLRHALTGAARDADELALREAVSSAEDDRLVASVDTTGLLPAPAATSTVAEHLTGAGIAAETAWAVLARDYPETDRARAASHRPDLVSGVVVQDDTARGRALTVLASAPTLAHIPLVTAADLDAAARGSSDGPPLPAVPLHEGLHTATPASSEADRLRNHGDARRERQAALTARAEADRTLLAQLSGFLEEYPDSDSRDLAATRTHAARQAAEKKLAEKSRHETAATTATADAETERAAARAAETLGRGHEKAAQTARLLAEAAARVAGHTDTIAASGQLVGQLRGRENQLEAERETVTARAAEHDNLRVEKTRLAGETRDHARAVTVVDPDRPPAADAVAAARRRGLTECLAGYETLRGQWNTAASESVLEAQLTSVEKQATDARRRADRVLETFDGDRSAVRATATARAADHTAADCETAAARAAGAVERSIVEVTQASSALADAARVLEDAAEARRGTSRGTDPVAYTTAEDAEERAAELTGRIADLISAETRYGNERDVVVNRAKEQRREADTLRDFAEQLPAAAATGAVEPFAGDVADARREVRAALARVTRTTEDHAAALEARSEYAKAALRLASHPTYADLTLALKTRLTDTDTAGLAAKAAQYAAEVAVRLTQVEELLTQIGADEDRVSRLVATHVRQLLTGISGAARASKLPAGLGDLSGSQFINLRFANPSDEELGSRVTQEILAMLDSAGDVNSLPSGETILRRCVHAAVGNKGFRVDVLKPNEHMLAQRVPVTDVARFSDGEKLTTCVLLFCAFARMRSAGRSGGATGTLMLDNPFGRASNAQLVALQLAVAKAQRVHLVYATGLEDMGALLQFRRLIRLRNRKPVGSTDGHVQLETAPGTRVGEVSGVTVARPSAPVPVEVAADPDEVPVP